MANREPGPRALPEWLDYVEHTADTGIRVWGPDPATVLARAAWGLLSLLVDPATVRVQQQDSLEIKAMTLCGLEFGPAGGRWVGQVMVDV